MEKVLGIGGLNPMALARWYADHLGVDLACQKITTILHGTSRKVPRSLRLSSRTQDYFGRPEQQWMINFRVRDLAAMVAQLREAGTEVEVDPEHYPNGWFARLTDAEGNPIQLWQPEGIDAAG